MKMYLPPLISLILAVPSMILVMLTIYSGHHAGFLEDYHVLYVSLAIAHFCRVLCPALTDDPSSSTLPLLGRIS